MPRFPDLGSLMRRVGSMLLGVAVVLAATGTARAVTGSSPDLVVGASSDATGPVVDGQRLTYDIVVQNVGAADATEVSVVDSLPRGLRLLGATTLAGEGGCDLTSTIDSQGNEWGVAFCRMPAVAAGDSVTIRIRGVLALDAGCGVLTSHVSVASPDEPRVARDAANQATTSDAVRCTCGIALRTSVAPAVASPGTSVRTTYTVRNTGDAPLLAITVRDGRLGLVHTIGHLSPGATRSVGIWWQVPGAGGRVTRGSRVTGSLPDGTRCAAGDHATVRIAHATTPGGATGGGTPFTGSSPLPLIALGVLLLLGVVALVVSRRRS